MPSPRKRRPLPRIGSQRPCILNIWEASSLKLSAFSLRRRLYYEIKKCRLLCNEVLKDRPFIYGLDLSLTGTGIAIINSTNKDMLAARYSTNAGLPLFERTTLILDWISGFYRTYPPGVIILEGTFASMRNLHSLALSRLNHAVECGLYAMGGALYKNLMPKSIKKYITGTCEAKKDDMQQAIQKDYGIWIGNNDMSDALCMAVLGFDLWRVINFFGISRFDVNDKQDMLDMEHKLREFLGFRYRADSILSIMGIGYSMSRFLREIKQTEIIRTFPRILTFNASRSNNVKKLLSVK